MRKRSPHPALLFLAMLAAASLAWILAERFVYRGLIVPRLVGWRHVPTYWWAALAAMPIAVCVGFGWRLRSLRLVATFAAGTGTASVACNLTRGLLFPDNVAGHDLVGRDLVQNPGWVLVEGAVLAACVFAALAAGWGARRLVASLPRRLGSRGHATSRAVDR